MSISQHDPTLHPAFSLPVDRPHQAGARLRTGVLDTVRLRVLEIMLELCALDNGRQYLGCEAPQIGKSGSATDIGRFAIMFICCPGADASGLCCQVYAAIVGLARAAAEVRQGVEILGWLQTSVMLAYDRDAGNAHRARQP